MSKHLSASTLRAVAQVIDMGKANELGQAIQALIEGKPFGESSLDSKIVGTFEDVTLTEANFRERIVYRGQELMRHRNGGGWVPVEQDETDLKRPFVADTAYVGPFSIVCGRARVLDTARLCDFTMVWGRAQISGDAHLFCDTRVSGTAKVSGGEWMSRVISGW